MFVVFQRWWTALPATLLARLVSLRSATGQRDRHGCTAGVAAEKMHRRRKRNWATGHDR